MADAKAESSKSKKTSGSKSEEMGFQAEVTRLLELMIHSVYAEREVFLRELISNASDACDKLRYEAIAKPELTAQDSDLTIKLNVDSEKKTLTITDNGIGMNRDELIENLGTIARSGTRAFMDNAQSDTGPTEKVDLIGQFGVGFYASFMVASRVEVHSTRAGNKESWSWSSNGDGKFSIAELKDDAPLRGTRIILHLRDDAAEFLESARLQHIVRTYSDHIALPIHLITTDDEEDQQLNSANALWRRSKSDISDEQYKEFFGHLSGLYNDPAHIIHYLAEGRHEYTVLLFIPDDKPFDLFDPERRSRQKLYVRRVYITDDAEILPAWLRFVRGVIDSEDMPLNISREMLQNNPIVHQISKAVTNRVLSELKKLAKNDKDKYKNVWDNFGRVLKEGLYEAADHRDDLFELARFTTAQNADQISLTDYVAAMKDNQKAIYYIAGDEAKAVANSPHLEGFKARGLDVLLLSDPIDSFWATTALGFDGKPFRSITQGASDLSDFEIADDDKKPTKKSDDNKNAKELNTLIENMKKTLGDKVSDIVISDRLTDSPVCLVAGAGGFDRALEKMLAQQNSETLPTNAPVLELNPDHTLIIAISKKTDNDFLEDAANLLLDQASILDGQKPDDAIAFAKRLTSVMTKAMD